MIESTQYNEKELFPPILAVDFDGTLVENKFPEIGEVNPVIWKAVSAYQAMGWKIILWSCRTETMLQDAVDFCAERGLTFDAVNENLPEVQTYYGGDTRKVFANMYIDDRSAGLYTRHDLMEFKPFGCLMED
nr:MAG TPA: nucleotidase 5'-nucleotidase [Caudoviricetes sp.]